MVYNIHLNMRKIDKIVNPLKMNQSSVLAYVDIDPNLLKEKDSWYFVNSKVSFFKKRKDARIAGECISKAYAEALGHQAADYSVVELNEKIGLLSPNFQDRSKFSYFDFCQLYQLFPSLPAKYNYFTLKEILRTFGYHYDEETTYQLQRALIERYVFEWFTHQLDGNPRNTNFQLDKKTNLLAIGPVFDKEQAFGVNESGFFDESKLDMWLPSIPYDDLSFRDKPYQIDDLDANILSLLMDYPDMTVEILEDVFKVDYKSILNRFSSGENSFNLPPETLTYLQSVVERKKFEKEKMLQLI